jgi:cytochrome c peroxidase
MKKFYCRLGPASLVAGSYDNTHCLFLRQRRGPLRTRFHQYLRHRRHALQRGNQKNTEDNCNSCHLPSGATYSAIPYETHAQLLEVALNGKLVERINDQASPMPETGLMDKCSRQKIEAWVRAGAPNN